MDPHSLPVFWLKIPKCFIVRSCEQVATTTTSGSEKMAATSSVISGQVSCDRNGWCEIGPETDSRRRNFKKSWLDDSGLLDQFWKKNHKDSGLRRAE